MAEQDNTQGSDSLLTRREMMGVSSGLLAAAMGVAGTAGTAAASATEPRIQIGNDYEIDDFDPGDGTSDLALEHQPSGNWIRYDASATEWDITADVDANSQTIKNVGSASIDSGTIDGDQILGGASSTSNAGITFGNWTVVDSNNPVLLELLLLCETDGTTDGNINVKVDESGGTTSDYRIGRLFVDPALGSGATIFDQLSIYLPEGASVIIENSSDPNSANSIREQRKVEL